MRILPWNGRCLLLTGLMVAGDTVGSPPVSLQTEVSSLVNHQYKYILPFYLHLHSNPELSLREVKTAERMTAELENVGFAVTKGIGGYGFVGVLNNGDGPVIMVRTDLDALPVTEATGLAYASKVVAKDDKGREIGVMHACGHDVHMSCFIGTARLLSELKQRWRGTLLMVGQPAEELSVGAKAMLADGLFQKFPKPNKILALHSDAGLEAGKVAICQGNALAGTDTLDVTIRGIGGHAAYSYTTKDPIVLAAQTVLALQTIVSREVRAIDPIVVTVGSIHGGTKHNVIPDEVQLQLTVRYYSDAARAHVLGSIERIVKGMAETAGVPKDREPLIKLREAESIPPVYNDPELARRVAHAIEIMLGKEGSVQAEPVMGGEDFGVFGRTSERIPITLFWLGTVSRQRMLESQRPNGKPLPSLHSSTFAPEPEATLKTGMKAMTAAVLDLMKP